MQSFTWFTSASTQQVVEKLETSIQLGLNDVQVKKRQSEYGLNRIMNSNHTVFKMILKQITSPFFYLLAFVGFISLAVREWYSGIVILLCVLINAAVSFYQEFRAEHELQSLKKYLVQYETIIRNGKQITISSEEIVPGDLVILIPGDRVPADMRLISAENAQFDESVLTGESMPVSKTAQVLKNPAQEPTTAVNCAFAGTLLMTGKAIGIVYATGDNTIMGDIAYLTISSMRESSFAKKIGQLGNVMILLVIITLVCVFAANVFLKAGKINLFNLFIFSTALAITVIPEALPVVVTFCLAQGVSRLAKKKVIVKRLSAIESLGSVQLVCTDKTGTLTENTLTIANIKSVDEHSAVWYAILAAESPFDAIGTVQKGFDYALWNHLDQSDRRALLNYKKILDIPFDPQRKRNSVLIEYDNNIELVCRGMVNEVVSRCTVQQGDLTDQFNKWVEEEETLGHRVIAIARKTKIGAAASLDIDKEEHDLELVGAISFVDPIKETAAQAIKKAQQLGIVIKVLSGDSKEVVGAVCNQIGLINDPKNVMTGSEFAHKSDQEKKDICLKFNAFSRILPEQKFEIIKFLQNDYEVGYMGDGINDAPALKIADVSIAVQDAVDSAREAADVILLQKSLYVIIDGIAEGRKIFANTFKYVKTTVASNFGNFYALSIITLLIDFLPMLPLHLLMVNLLSDFPMIAISTDAVDEAFIKKPTHYQAGDILIPATILGVVSSVFDLIYFALFKNNPPTLVQTGWFTLSILTEIVFIYSIRTERFFLRAPRPSMPLMLLSCIACVIAIVLPFIPEAQKIFTFMPMQPTQLLKLCGLVAIYFVITETVKCAYYHQRNNQRRN